MVLTRAGLALVAFFCSVALVGGCGGKPAVCGDVDSLKSSLQALKKVNVVKNGTSSLQSAVNKVKSDAQKLIDDAKQEFKPQTDALQSAVTSLQNAVNNVVVNGTAPVQAAAKSVQSATTSLENAVKSKCS